MLRIALSVFAVPALAIAAGWLYDQLRARRTVGTCNYCEAQVDRGHGVRRFGLWWHWTCWTDHPPGAEPAYRPPFLRQR